MDEVVHFIINKRETVKWHNQRSVKIEKLEDGRLGIVLLPINIPQSKETLTIISRVNDDCKYMPKDWIPTVVRVAEIDGHDITSLDFDDVTRILNDVKCRKKCVCFTVYSPILWQDTSDNRRYHDFENGTSAGITVDVWQESFQDSVKQMRGINDTIVPLHTVSPDVSVTETADKLQPLATSSQNTVSTDTGAAAMTNFTVNSEALEEVTIADCNCVDLVNETLKDPCRVKWSEERKIVVIKKRKEDLIGLHYKIKKAPQMVYFLVEDIDKKFPCDGKLHKGDWVLSVNKKTLEYKELKGKSNSKSKSSKKTKASTGCEHFPPKLEGCLQRMGSFYTGVFCPASAPVTSVAELFKREIEKSKKVYLVIRTPESIDPESSKVTHHVRKNFPLGLPAERVNRRTKMIEARSAYNVSMDTMSLAGRSGVGGGHPLKMFRDRPHLNIPTGLKSPQQATVAMPNFVPPIGIRGAVPSRMRSDVNTILPNVYKVDRHAAGVPHEHDVQIHLGRGLSQVDAISSEIIVSKCQNYLEYLAEEDLKHIPYMAVNVIAATKSKLHLTNILQRLKAEFGCRSNHLGSETHNFLIGKHCLEHVKGSISSELTIEDLIIAKHLTKNLKGTSNDVFIERMKQILSEDKCCVEGLPNKLLNAFLEDPPALDKDYMEIKFQAFSYEEVLHLWPTVHFAASSTYIVVFDVDALETNQMEEIRRIQTCLNLIHTSSANTKIYLVGKSKSSTNLVTVMSEFESLNLQLKNQKNTCLPCACNTENLYSDVYSQIQRNGLTEHVAYWADRGNDLDCSAFIKDLKAQFCRDFCRGEQRFPFIAAMVMKRIKEHDFNTMATATTAILKEAIMDKVIPGVGEETFSRILEALHHCGKICSLKHVAHRTVHTSAHNKFVLLKPEVLDEVAVHISNHHASSIWSPGSSQTQSDICDSIMAKYPDSSQLFLFLEVFHIFEERPPQEENGPYLYAYTYIQEEEAKDLKERVSAMMQNNLCAELYVDFHGLLPLTMCLWLLRRLGETMGEKILILSTHTAVFGYDRVQFMVHLLPYQGKAVVFVSPEYPLPLDFLYNHLWSSLSSAIHTDLLTYHVGQPCLSCVDHYPRDWLAKIHSDPLTKGRVAHIQDFKVVRAAPIMQTPLQHVPAVVSDILVQSLSLQDTTRQTAGWEILYERFGCQDTSLLRQLHGTANPARAFYNHLRNQPIYTSLNVGVVLDCVQGTTSSSQILKAFHQIGFLRSNTGVSMA